MRSLGGSGLEVQRNESPVDFSAQVSGAVESRPAWEMTPETSTRRLGFMTLATPAITSVTTSGLSPKGGNQARRVWVGSTWAMVLANLLAAVKAGGAHD